MSMYLFWTVQSSHETLTPKGFQLQGRQRYNLSKSHTETGFRQKTIRELCTLKYLLLTIFLIHINGLLMSINTMVLPRF
jgi:hypothetical protein